MGFKFVMYRSGIGFYPNVAKHDECYAITPDGCRARPIAAGTAFTLENGTIDLSGYSINLGMGAEGSYPDWLERHQKSGLPPQRKIYQGWSSGECFFLPFEPVARFGVEGIGKSVPRYDAPADTVTLEEVIECLKK
jgi:hypothetical protein